MGGAKSALSRLTAQSGNTALCGVMALLLTSCGGVTTNVQNAPAPVEPQVSIAYQTAPPTSILIGRTARFSAVVSNDSVSEGVDWSLTCATPGNCGSLASVHTASGGMQTYTPPPTLSSNNLGVTISAFATADHSKNMVSGMNVSAFGAVLHGTYVLATNGSDTSGNPYQRLGVIALDGNGSVMAGEQTSSFVNQNTGILSPVSDTITGGSYFIGADGRGTLRINTSDTNVGQQGIETFSLVVLSNLHVLVTKFDDPNLQGSSNESSTGTLDLQNGPMPPTKGYAFVASGTDSGGGPLAFGGVLNIDSPQAISGTGSALDMADLNNNGPGAMSSSTALSGTVSTPDSFGTFQISLLTDVANVQFTGYTVDPSHVKLIETDGSVGFTVGQAISQGSATGTFKRKLKFAGQYAFGIFGRDLTSLSSSLSAAGVFSAIGNGALHRGFIDEAQAGDVLQISDGFHALYGVGPGNDPTIFVDPAGTGRFYIQSSPNTGFPRFTFSTRGNGTGPALVFYATESGGPLLILSADVEPSLASGLFGGGVATGIAYPVVAGAPFSGSYGTIFTQNLEGIESDVVGKFSVAGNTLSGVLDIGNGPSGPQADDPSLSGTIQNSAISGRLTVSLTDNFFISASTPNLLVSFYPIDSTQGFFVETDLADSAGNLISDDLTFGYYMRRTPVCQGCP